MDHIGFSMWFLVESTISPLKGKQHSFQNHWFSADLSWHPHFFQKQVFPRTLFTTCRRPHVLFFQIFQFKAPNDQNARNWLQIQWWIFPTRMQRSLLRSAFTCKFYDGNIFFFTSLGRAKGNDMSRRPCSILKIFGPWHFWSEGGRRWYAWDRLSHVSSVSQLLQLSFGKWRPSRKER